MKKIRLTQIDGKLPNLALMKLSHYFKSIECAVYFEKSITKGLFEPEYDLVLGSAIFSSSNKKIQQFLNQFPGAIIGGTGSQTKNTVESYLNISEYEHYDYSIYPTFQQSIGFSQRGCRLNCKFCVVPQKEGKIHLSRPISEIWRGEPYPRQIHLLDNDFFGDPNWKIKCEEIIEGNYEICLNQGINVRLINAEQANYLSKVKYRDDQFKTSRIYTAWDNKKDEKIFQKGIETMLNVGIKPKHIMVYFLIGYWKDETFDDVYYRFSEIKKLGLLPYPMVYGENPLLKKFQRWVVRRFHQFIEWKDYQKVPYAILKTQNQSLL